MFAPILSLSVNGVRTLIFVNNVLNPSKNLVPTNERINCLQTHFKFYQCFRNIYRWIQAAKNRENEKKKSFIYPCRIDQSSVNCLTLIEEFVVKVFNFSIINVLRVTDWPYLNHEVAISDSIKGTRDGCGLHRNRTNI